MSEISTRIRSYVNDPSISKDYGAWGALRPDQRKQIRKLCDECDMFEKAADYFALTLYGVMHSVDKWLDGDELKQDEVNRAATMREKTLRLLENAKTEAAREIFAEIEELFFKNGVFIHIQSYNKLKKKYTEGKDGETN